MQKDVNQTMRDPFQLNPDSCVQFVEARSVQPGSTTSPPDNGAGAGQDEAPPPVITGYDYTLFSVLTHTAPPGSSPPKPGDPVVFAAAPGGMVTPC